MTTTNRGCCLYIEHSDTTNCTIRTNAYGFNAWERKILVPTVGESTMQPRRWSYRQCPRMPLPTAPGPWSNRCRPKPSRSFSKPSLVRCRSQAGTDWHKFWTGERLTGGMKITVDAPIETIPLFVRAGSIVPLRGEVESTHETHTIASMRVYSGADGDFTLFSDDGIACAYEKGAGSITRLYWDDAAGKLTHEGTEPWTGPDNKVVEVVGR